MGTRAGCRHRPSEGLGPCCASRGGVVATGGGICGGPLPVEAAVHPASNHLEAVALDVTV